MGRTVRRDKHGNRIFCAKPAGRFTRGWTFAGFRQLSARMWNLTVPWWELIVRSVIVYAFLIAVLRLSGKRQIGQLAPFDLVLLLVLSNAVQNAMNGGDNSVTAGIVSAATLICLNFLMGYVTYRSKRMERWVEGQPEVLIHNGRLFEKAMAHAQLTHHELNAALRQAGCASVAEVHFAILENNGSITVTPRAAAAPPPVSPRS